MVTIIADVDYVSGHLRSGHFGLHLTEEDYTDFQNLNRTEQEAMIREGGHLVVDDYEVYDIGDIFNIDVMRD